MNMFELLEQYYDLINMGIELSNNSKLTHYNSIDNIIYAGMGGSAIAGDIIRELLYKRIDIPFDIIRNYELPSYANNNSLIILSSFSGNTEETISIAKQAQNINANILCYSSNGILYEKFKHYNFVKPNINIPPRSALPMSLFAILNALNITLLNNNEIRYMINETKELINKDIDKKKAELYAKQLHNKIPIIYTSVNNFSIARRFANQLSENANHFAHFNEIPEMNHNEIVGLELPKIINDNFIIVFIEDKSENNRISKRFDILRDILSNDFDIINIDINGENELHKKINTIRFIDYISYYLAIKNNIDPIEIKRIDILKSRLKI